MTTRTASTKAVSSSSRDLPAEVAFLTRALKAPTLREAVPRLVERARAESGPTRSSWSPACNARCPRGRATAVRAASAPPASRAARVWRSSTSTTPAVSSATSSPTSGRWTSSPPRTQRAAARARRTPARPTWPPGWRSAPAKPAIGCCSRPPPSGCTRLADAHHAGRLQDELRRLGRYPLLVIDEVGYIPFEPEAANLFFQLISSRYERASLIVTSNKPFGRWGEVFGDEVVAAAMIDRLVHHAEVIALKGRQLPTQRPRPRTRPSQQDRRQLTEGSTFTYRKGVSFQSPLTLREPDQGLHVVEAEGAGAR